ncbi:hypothetical protein [Priestia endophytica]|uniref:hypothetical protein n=1 Tax=Priestia endophytica TaxID=135735 RepID=UPI00228081EC|nr:hypothetical protein [Priestia endophytica]MCY8233607.1 hypothetical protein [Priestia endophytica]
MKFSEHGERKFGYHQSLHDINYHEKSLENNPLYVGMEFGVTPREIQKLKSHLERS